MAGIEESGLVTFLKKDNRCKYDVVNSLNILINFKDNHENCFNFGLRQISIHFELSFYL